MIQLFYKKSSFYHAKGDIMIPRYTREEMGHIWSERNEFDTMLLVETLASEAQAELGSYP